MLPVGLLESFTRGAPWPPTSLSFRRVFSSSLRPLAPAAARPLADDDVQHSYSSTVTLPKTAFPLRANAASREHLFRHRTTAELYAWQEKQMDRPLFVLHDGPPYANGHLHIGHFMNKTLKDFILRYKLLQGYRVHYVPGYDTHGLPLELKALANMKVPRGSLTPQQIRAAARAEAERGIAIQAEEFRQFGGLGAFGPGEAYRTLDWSYEKRQLHVVGEMVKKGLITTHHRPTLYSPSSMTALAEAELEYRDDHVSKSVYVACPVIKLGGLENVLERANLAGTSVDLAIWTTTPWTLPSNVAIAISDNMEYSLVRQSNTSSLLVVGSSRRGHLAEVMSSVNVTVSFETLATFSGSVLLSTTYLPPLSSNTSTFTPHPVFSAPYVTSTSGTGLVHTAPAHGIEDWEAWRDFQSSLDPSIEVADVLCAVDIEGKFSKVLARLVDEDVTARLVGKSVLGDGSNAVVELLEERGRLLKAVDVAHKYPYDWRTKKPVIFRASSQWFANLEKIKDDAIASLDAVTFFPPRGKRQLEQFVRGRSEWCISRQRAWGVPIPVVYSYPTDSTDPISTSTPYLTPSNINHIVSVLDSHGKGTDYWWDGAAEEFVEPAELERSRTEGRIWRKGTDTMDVWFDSGVSWSLIRELNLRSSGSPTDPPLADVYLEGGDQHRGWFQSSLLAAISASDADLPKAPYGTLITHGMVLDEHGRKMSKSLGNVLSPLEVIHGKKSMPAFGVDLLRMWVASVDSTSDVPIGRGILDQIHEALRKVRNTSRFLLGALANEPVEAQSSVQLSLIERYILHELYELDQTARDGYNNFAFSRVYQALTTFSNSTLSSFYFNIAKDSLYADSRSSSRRRAVIFTLHKVLETYVSVLAPIAPHLAEEVFHFASGALADPASNSVGSGSVFQRLWAHPDSRWQDLEVKGQMAELLSVRAEVLGLLEQARSDKRIRSSTEAQVIIRGASVNVVRNADILDTLFVVSGVLVDAGRVDVPAEASWSYSSHNATDTHLSVTILPAAHLKCPRCWTYTRPDSQELCGRCASAVAP